MKIAAFLLLLSSAAAFLISPQLPHSSINSHRQHRCAIQRTITVGTGWWRRERQWGATSSDAAASSLNDSLQMPLSYNEMIQQVSSCMSDAYNSGFTRQIVRILLPRDASFGQFGEFYEADAQITDRSKSQELKLVPTDESWYGGIMQLYRAASPTTKDILTQLSPTAATTGLPPKIIEDRSIDESGVDGVGLMYTQSRGRNEYSPTIDTSGKDNGVFGFFGESVSLPVLSENDMCVFVQPNQEVVDVIEKLSSVTESSSSATSTPLIALLNPQWRTVDDALDSASKSGGILGSVASFLGGKGSVLRRLGEAKFFPTYTLEGYVCKGGNIRLIKRFDSDWIVFAENDNGDQFVRVGSMKDRPTYQNVEKMLDDKGVGYKYARDLGMSPKL
jgi:hypothetical protein